MTDLVQPPKIQFKVFVKCYTFNHASYIVDAMNGFSMQQTDFPFICIIVDDASTDGEPDVIRQYISTYFDFRDDSVAKNEETDDFFFIFAQHRTNPNCYFAVYWLKYNHYKKKAKAPYFKDLTNDVKYVALCEGDDYWTDPLKLIKQVNYMDTHPDCCMISCASQWVSNDSLFSISQVSQTPRDLSTEEVILGGGKYLSTCSLLFKQEMNYDIPRWRRIANVGDYPLQIQGTLYGKLHYLPDVMCVYRRNHPGSWTSNFSSGSLDNRLRHYYAEIQWMKELDRDTHHKYKKIIFEHHRLFFPMLYRKRMVSTLDYFHSVLLVGKGADYISFIKNVIKRVFRYHYPY